jgi:hypothetical protein
VSSKIKHPSDCSKMSTISEMTDIKKLKQMLVETNKLVPECAVENIQKMTRCLAIQDRIKELEIEDVRCCLNWGP